MSEEKKKPFVEIVTDTADQTDTMDKNDVESNKLMGVLSYLTILVLIPIFAAKGSKFARFHANQGLIICIAGVILGVTTKILSNIPFVKLVCPIIDLVPIAYSILGIVYVVQGKAKDLPFIGGIKLLK